MAVNSAFHTSNQAAITTEKNLYADLVAEAIQIYGHDVHYLDRTLVAEDTFFGEDSLSKFNTQAKIEMYVENTGGGYAGERELMTQFGLQNLSEVTFVVSKNRFRDITKQFTIESGTDTLTGSILLESGTLDSDEVDIPSSFESGYLISEADSTDADRPQEGDAIYHPILGKLFEINFVDHDQPFHQLDNNPVYKMSCRLFEYGSEILDTDIAVIDAIEDAESLDALTYQFTLEQSATTTINQEIRIDHATSDGSGVILLDRTDTDGTDAGDNLIGEDETPGGESILLENAADEHDESYLISEEYIVGDQSTDKVNQNELFDELDDTILDFSESNPFGDAGEPS